MMDPSPSSFLLLPPTTTPTTQEVKMEKVSIATSPPSYACASHPWLLASQPARGTFIIDVWRFSMIFDLPSNHVRRFLPYNIRVLGRHFGPTYPKNGHYEGTFPRLLAGWLDKDSENEEGSLPACVQPPAWVLAESSKIHAYLSFCRPWSHSIWCDCCITSFYLGFKKWEILWNTTKKLRKRNKMGKPLADTVLIREGFELFCYYFIMYYNFPRRWWPAVSNQPI